MKKSRLAARKEVKSKKKRNYFKYVLILVLVLMSILLFSFFTNRSWDGKSRLGIVKEEQNGDVTVLLLDPSSSSVTSITIPKETEVTASHQLGTWKLESIWKLGYDQKLGGAFLKDTIIKSFRFPVDAWEGGGQSSLSVWDRLQALLFTTSVKATQKTNINLSDTSYLIKSKLVDGSMGYKILPKMPISLSSYFVDTDLFKKNLNLVINNASGSDAVAGTLGEIVEVLGIKVASIQKVPIDSGDCTIAGTQLQVVTKMAKIFSCKIGKWDSQNNFDIQINIGKNFKDRF